MAGVGLDMAIMDNTDDAIKSSFGSLAYVLAAMQQMGSVPLSVKVSVDEAKPIRRKAQLCLIGNVGRLQGDVELIPEASADDGLLDVMVASPRRLVHWFRFLIKVLGRKDRAETRVDHVRGTAGDGGVGRSGEVPTGRGRRRILQQAAGRGGAGGAHRQGRHGLSCRVAPSLAPRSSSTQVGLDTG